VIDATPEGPSTWAAPALEKGSAWHALVDRPAYFTQRMTSIICWLTWRRGLAKYSPSEPQPMHNGRVIERLFWAP
jgi:hypothetical protein